MFLSSAPFRGKREGAQDLWSLEETSLWPKWIVKKVMDFRVFRDTNQLMHFDCRNNLELVTNKKTCSSQLLPLLPVHKIFRKGVNIS